MKSYEQYLRDSAVSKEVIDVFLDRSAPAWAQFDAELGYTLGNSMPRDGLDGCSTISTAQKNGARTARMYVEQPCRINTYGNSFTQCHQVSDGETWQEYLAAHLGEPIRNYGVGGYGVYQAHRRMVRTEPGDQGAPYVMVYLWGDDHCRSVLRCRHAATYPGWDDGGGLLFHGNFWANIEMDLETGQFVERANLLSTPQSLYQMTNPDFMVESLRQDLMLQLYAVGQVEPSSLDLARLNALAEILGVAGIQEIPADTWPTSAAHVRAAYGFAATKHILNLARTFCQANRKKLLVVLACPIATRQLLLNEPRYDQEIIDFLNQSGFRYFDMNVVHRDDFKNFNLSIADYMKRYYIGHYSPAGNHFFAYSIKDTLVKWLDPKPITYCTNDSVLIDCRAALGMSPDADSTATGGTASPPSLAVGLPAQADRGDAIPPGS